MGSKYPSSVSIRSPHRSKGRLDASTECFRDYKFQSAPLTEARGDAAINTASSASRCFNPLPSPKQGETKAHCWRRRNRAGFNPLPSPKQGETKAPWPLLAIERRFNPLPSPKQGETDVFAAARLAQKVSIRSPHRSKGRLHTATSSGPWISVSIRSPHRSKGRLVTITEVDVFGFVSIRSPHRSKGDSTASVAAIAMHAFQSAPLTEARGDPMSPSNETAALEFQSAHRSKGRLPNTRPLRRLVAFQSAPLTEARGDESHGLAVATRRRFNPLPSPKQGETFLGQLFF